MAKRTAPVVAVLLVPNDTLHVQVILGLNTVVTRHGLSVSLVSSHADAVDVPAGAVVVAAADGLARHGLGRGADPVIAVLSDLSDQGIPSVGIDDAAVGRAAADHLLGLPVRSVGVFTWSHGAPMHEFARRRTEGFEQAVAHRGGPCPYAGRYAYTGAPPADKRAATAWLADLPRPAGVFTCCDEWAGLVYEFARAAGLAVPRDVCVVGAGNMPLHCQLLQPNLSSVLIPWQAVGVAAGELALDFARGAPDRDPRPPGCLVSPAGVAERASTDLRGLADPLVDRARTFIRARAGAGGPLTAADVVRHARCSRRTLERAVRRTLGSTVLDQIHGTRVEFAQHLLATTHLDILDIARRCGFGHVTTFNRAFRRVTGMSPTAYRSHR